MFRTSLAVTTIIMSLGSNGAFGQRMTGVELPATEPGPGYHHASTIQQGWLDGWASVIRAWGLADYNHGLAARHWQMATEHGLRNSLTSVDTYFKRQTHNRVYRKMLSGPPMTTERATKLSERRLPARLGANEFDRMYGQIQWPDGLLADEFSADRSELAELFRRRTPQASGRGTQSQRRISHAVQAMETKLRDHVRQYDAEMYLSARRFLKGLKYESYFAVEHSHALARVR